MVGGNVDHIHRRDLYSAPWPSRRNGFYRATQLCYRGFGSRNSVRLPHACFLTKPNNLPVIFVYHNHDERTMLLVICDFSYSCAAADKISSDLRARAVSLRQLSNLYLLFTLPPSAEPTIATGLFVCLTAYLLVTVARYRSVLDVGVGNVSATSCGHSATLIVPLNNQHGASH